MAKQYLDRRIVYVLIALSLAVPLVFGYSLKPAPMRTADDVFSFVENLETGSGKIVIIAADWGPSTQAENLPQTAVVVEHLMRRRQPFALISMIQYAAPYLENLPLEIAEKLEAENPGKTWDYGRDWVNFGFQPGASIMIQGLAKARNFRDVLATDASGTRLSELPIMNGVQSIVDVSALFEITGSVGAFQAWLQFFQAGGYQPALLHGCTSVTIPEAFNYYVSGQIKGFFEGAAGAAWYDYRLAERFPNREAGTALRMNTGISVAHLIIIALIVIGNLEELKRAFRGKRS